MAEVKLIQVENEAYKEFPFSTDSTIGDGSAASPLKLLNIKKVPAGKFFLVPENNENVVTRIQVIEGVLIVDGVNTIL